MALSRDIVTQIFSRLDGTTLAKAECSSADFLSIARQEFLWEDACRSLWPSSVADDDVKRLISSMGGFKKFYADCFPLINVCKRPLINSKEYYHNISNLRLSGDCDREISDRTVSPSDFVSVVDIKYKDRTIFSKVVWEIPVAHDMVDMTSSVFPFLIDIPCINCSDGISILDRSKEEDVESNLLLANMRLSWIVINRRTKQAVNLSSWRPLEAHKQDWCCDNYSFTVNFGSIVPAHNMPMELGVCNIVVRCRVDHETIEIGDISLQLEDMMGCQVSVKEGVVILQEAVECCSRSKNYDQVIQSCHDMLEVQSDMMEENHETHWQMDPLSILFSVVILFLSCYYFFI